jgi:alkylation response protein AidB-like acyl-CoA dehydrogenase
MTAYRAPLQELRYAIGQLWQDRPPELRSESELSSELIHSVLDEASRFAAEVLDPINKRTDTDDVHLAPDGVRAAEGFASAYRSFVAAGWPQLSAAASHGGQGAPQILNSAVQEIWASANLSFKLCTMLTQAAVEVLERFGSAAQQLTYLPKLVSGEWTGTMALTESQAGSDLSLIRTRAHPEGGHYRLHGQKIFITWGEHDLTDNIIHMVLGRIDGSPPGTKGLSLFLVPRMLVRSDGALGARNEVRCISVERKLGEPNRGLEYMFVMMNASRLAVGVEGYALTQRAFQAALDWAKTRIQGSSAGTGAVPIIEHPDVKRMLLAMSSGACAMRLLTLYSAAQLDWSRQSSNETQGSMFQARAELLVPIVKGWCSEFGNELTSLAMQVHGGMGYVEETGVAQYLRDVRISTIYEGTTGIQANDLIRRKLARDSGAAMLALLTHLEQQLRAFTSTEQGLLTLRSRLLPTVRSLRRATDAILNMVTKCPDEALAVAVPYLLACGFTISGWLMLRTCVPRAPHHDLAGSQFLQARTRLAAFYATHTLSRAVVLARTVREGDRSVAEMEPALFEAV